MTHEQYLERIDSFEEKMYELNNLLVDTAVENFGMPEHFAKDLIEIMSKEQLEAMKDLRQSYMSLSDVYRPFFRMVNDIDEAEEELDEILLDVRSTLKLEIIVKEKNDAAKE